MHTIKSSSFWTMKLQKSLGWILCVCVCAARQKASDRLENHSQWNRRTAVPLFRLLSSSSWHLGLQECTVTLVFYRKYSIFFKSLLTYWHLLERQSDRERERHEYFLSSGSLSRCLQQPDQSQEPKTSSVSSTLAVIISQATLTGSWIRSNWMELRPSFQEGIWASQAEA